MAVCLDRKVKFSECTKGKSVVVRGKSIDIYSEAFGKPLDSGEEEYHGYRWSHRYITLASEISFILSDAVNMYRRLMNNSEDKENILDTVNRKIRERGYHLRLDKIEFLE